MLNKSLLIKLTGSLIVGGGIAGVGTAYVLSNEKETNREKITFGGKRTILDINSNGWDIKLHAYKSLSNKVGNINNDSDLKIWCTNTLNSKFKDEKDKDYLQAQKVCTAPTNKEKLLKEQKELAGSADWQGRATAYTTEGVGDKAIPALNGKKTPTNKEIEEWCNNALENEIKGGQNNYDLALKWCTKTGN